MIMMPNKYVVVGCNTGHKKGKRKREKGLEVPQTIPVSSEKKAMFHFPKNSEELSAKWLKFVSRVNWKHSDCSVICSDHFEAKYLLCGDKITHLNRELDAVPTIYSVVHVPTSSLLPFSSSSSRNPPTDRTEPDQLPYYHGEHKICDLDALNENLLSGFTFKKYDDHAICFLVEFSSGIPRLHNLLLLMLTCMSSYFIKILQFQFQSGYDKVSRIIVN